MKGYICQIRAKNKTIGFVPTMGALHDGHVSLIRQSKKDCDYTICSIFVNPTQFNDKSDLERYPRMPQKDISLLESAYCDALFMPSVAEMYPEGTKKETFDFGYLDNILEGVHRPGHFNGVAQIVKRFFEIVSPDKAFFGSKDYQQVMIVKALAKQMNSGIEIVSCPIRREPDGLAMSSRNALLNPEERILAKKIPEWMIEANTLIKQKNIEEAKDFIKEQVASHSLMKLDYYEVCEADTLKPVDKLENKKNYVAVIACFVGRIRLIDNLPVN